MVFQHAVLESGGAAMTIWQTLRAGIGLLSGHKRLWAWFYGVITIWALAVAAPAIAVMLASLGETAWAEQMTRNFDLQWIVEILAQKGSLPFLPLLVSGGAVFAIAAIR